MPINHQLKTIFVHIPKTGGTSLEYALGMHGKLKTIGLERYIDQKADVEHLFGAGLQHYNARQIKSYIGDVLFSNYLKVSIVRNPFDRLVSFLAWRNAGWYKKQILSIETFQNYLIRSQKRFLKQKLPLPCPQYDFLYARKKLLVDFIIYFEQLEEGLKKLSIRLNTDLKLEHRMNSWHLDYRLYYDEFSMKLAQKLYKKDFLHFNYNPDEIRK